jgi:hypothetical protein
MDTAVGLVKAYLELSGYFVLAEVPVRMAHAHGYRDVTDLDILAVRFPHTATGANTPVYLDTDPALAIVDHTLDVIVGEVKEGQAKLNPALHRAAVVAFALRRIGCCPADQVDAEAASITRTGFRMVRMPGGPMCRIRLIAFAGAETHEHSGLQTVSLAHCDAFIRHILDEDDGALLGAQVKDPLLALYALQAKLRRQTSRPDRQSTPTTGGTHHVS